MTDTSAWQIDPAGIDIAGDMTLLVARRKGKGIAGYKLEFAKQATTELREAMAGTLTRLATLRRRDYEPSLVIGDEEYMAVPDQLVSVAAPPLPPRTRRSGRTPPNGGGSDGSRGRQPRAAGATIETDPEVRRFLRDAAGHDPLPAGSLAGRPFLFYAVVVGNDPRTRSAFVRKHNPAVSLAAGRLLFSYEDRLTRVEHPLFSLDDHFDLVVTPEGILVLNQSIFDALFRDAKVLVDRYPIWAKAFSTLRIGSDQVDVLVERCRRDSRLAHRLRQIHESGHLAAGRVKLDQVLAEADRLGLGRHGFLKDGKLDFGCQDIGTLLKLLNDDLFIGGLSQVAYEAGSKARQRPGTTGGS